MTVRTTKPPKTLSSLKSSAHRKSGDKREYANFFQIGALELERWRREREREIAHQKVLAIDERLNEINQEILELLRGTDVEKIVEGKVEAKAEDETLQQGFNIKY